MRARFRCWLVGRGVVANAAGRQGRRAAPAAAAPRGGPCSGTGSARRRAARATRQSRVHQSERARRRPHRRDRHHRRPRLRLRAFQAARLPARQGSGADLRRRPVAGEYARRAEGAGGRMHHRHLLLDRQARHLLSGDPQAGLCRRPHRRHPHLVARDADQQEADRGSAQGRDRERLQRGEMGAGRHLAVAVLPLPGAAAPAGNGHLSRRTQHRDVLLRSRLLRLQGAQRAGRSSTSR